jgi:Caspase domain/Protein of unknown function (DUF1566)
MVRQLFRRFQLQSALILVMVAALFMGLMVNPLEVQAQTTKQSTVSELPGSKASAKRIALIIGNHQYQRLTKLPNAGRDADAMAVALKAAGFTPTTAKDVSYTEMVEVVAKFLKTIKKGDEVVVFFSGHGVQIPKQGGYLLPIDVSTTSASKVDKTAYELETLMAEVAEANPAFSLFIVDACRDNPFATKGVGTGFTNPEAAQGQIVLFAASRNQQALEKLSDDDKDPNGVFTREFIKVMKTPGLEISDLMKEVQNSVEKLADKVGHKQRPAIVNEARGNFYFFGPTIVQVNVANVAAPTTASLAHSNPGKIVIDGFEILDDSMLGKGSLARDLKTGLIWQRCGVGQTWDGGACTGQLNKYNFSDAVKLSTNAWRVPTVRELSTLIWCSTGKTRDVNDPNDGGVPIANFCGEEFKSPTIYRSMFSSSIPQSNLVSFWTASSSSKSNDKAWYVDFLFGLVDDSADSKLEFYIRLVK